MSGIVVSAPGKLVLFGEYAVLFGAPAAVAAVDRRAVVSLRPSVGGDWEVAAPGLTDIVGRFEIDADGAPCWRGGEAEGEAYPLVERLFAGIAATGDLDLVGVSGSAMSLDTRAFFEGEGRDRVKLGLGSSAALTVALAEALSESVGRGATSQRDWLQKLVGLHRVVQGGAGSGIDVAASLLGGVLRYRLADNGSVAEAAQLNLPHDLRMTFVWTGRSASTGDFLERLRVRREEEPAEVEAVLDGLGVVSASGVDALAADDAEKFLVAVTGFWDALEKLGQRLGLPILSEEHRLLHRLALNCGARYKPSGAGGGDFGIAFATDPGALVELQSSAGARGFGVPALSVDPSGATRSRS